MTSQKVKVSKEIALRLQVETIIKSVNYSDLLLSNYPFQNYLLMIFFKL